MPVINASRYYSNQLNSVTGGLATQPSYESLVSAQAQAYPSVLAMNRQLADQQSQMDYASRAARYQRMAANREFYGQLGSTAFSAATHPAVYNKYTVPAMKKIAGVFARPGAAPVVTSQGNTTIMNFGGLSKVASGAPKPWSPTVNVVSGQASGGITSAGASAGASTSPSMFARAGGVMRTATPYFGALGVGSMFADRPGMSSEQEVGAGALGGALTAGLLATGPLGWGALGLGAAFGAIGSRSHKIKKWFKKVF